MTRSNEKVSAYTIHTGNITRYKSGSAKTSIIPIEHHHNQYLGETFQYPTEYKNAGRQISVTITRLDISYAVPNLSQFLASPKVDHDCSPEFSEIPWLIALLILFEI